MGCEGVFCASIASRAAGGGTTHVSSTARAAESRRRETGGGSRRDPPPLPELLAELVPDALHRRLEDGDVLRRVVGGCRLCGVHLREQGELHLRLEVADARCLIEVPGKLRRHRSYAAFFETLAYISWNAATTPRMLSASLPSSSSPVTSTSRPSTSPIESLSAT